METEILLHRINWWLDDDSVAELDEDDTYHIKKCIEDGYREGDLNHGQKQIRGWWKIMN